MKLDSGVEDLETEVCGQIAVVAGGVGVAQYSFNDIGRLIDDYLLIVGWGVICTGQ